MNKARERYENRTAERDSTRQVLDRRGILYADAPERVNKRLARLGADWSLASALEQTPRKASTGSSLQLTPESFGTDVLGLERLMGRNDLIGVGFLEAGAVAARSIGRITVQGADAHLGTGFMVSPSLLLTNNHVLRNEDEAGRGFIEFNFQAGVDGRALVPVAFDLQPQRFFATDVELDFTLVAVAEVNQQGAQLAAFGSLPLSEAQGQIILGELVNIIQHPNGESKQLALRENEVVDLLEKFVHYETDTAPGSSGSPVFNDQWEVIALHHSGVPRTDAAGNLLATDGTPWTPDMGEDRLDWRANEGVRISRVLQALRQLPVTGAAAELRDEVFARVGTLLPVEGVSAPAPDGATVQAQATVPTLPQSAPVATARPDGSTAVTTDGTVRWSVPLNISVSLAGTGTQVPAVQVSPAAVTPTPPAPSAAAQPDGSAVAATDVQAALVNIEAGQARPYFDRVKDSAAREAYYARAVGATGAALQHLLTDLLEATHEHRPTYKPMRMLYPWVDLHPDRQLRGVYSAKTFTPEELIRADAAVEAARIARWQEILLRESTAGPAELEAEFDALEAVLPFNCEHTVPQSWFQKKEPMRGDLHHLFACDSGCNSFRGNFPYFDFVDHEEAVRSACGRRETRGFEPVAGKGAVARATMYFLLRYPKLIGDAQGEFPRERMQLLLTWHAENPVTDYERHRNFAIFEIQGNRNPLIDHPEWASQIDFTAAWP